ncbi:MAG: TolC family outer membrane protein [Hyphomicrobium sp.]|nr:TolC family outer membrane protein [Hyphomicrobium sp.]
MPGVDIRHRPTDGGRQTWSRMARLRASACALSLALFVGSFPAELRADTLSEALASAYEKNPRLDAERARLRATDEDVARAMSGYRPQVGVSAELGRASTHSRPGTSSDGNSGPWGYQISVSQPLFTGFRSTSTLNEAEADVRAGRQTLRRVEAEVLLDAAAAYLDVIRDTAIVRIREKTVDVLSRELDAARARRAAREVTLTDVAQAEARRARALSEADRAKAELKVSRARYQQVVGKQPMSLRAPPLKVKGMPRSLDEALDIAHAESPNVQAALYREESSRHNVDKISGELLPQVSVDATWSQSGDTTGLYADEDDARVTGRVSMPLYEGGETRARIRQAKHLHVSRLQEIEQARNETEANVTAAWSRLGAARAQLKSDEIQVEASRTALEGVREEERVGQRLLLDVLNAEQEYLEAQVQAVVTKRNLVVASYAVLAEIGRLNGETVETGGLVYDPEVHYQGSRDEWFSTDITDRSGRDVEGEVLVDAEIAAEAEVGAPVIVEEPSARARLRIPDEPPSLRLRSNKD